MPRMTPEMIERACALRAAGTPWKVIGRTLGVDPDTARGALEPEWFKARQARVQEARRVRRARASVAASYANPEGMPYRPPEGCVVRMMPRHGLHFSDARHVPVTLPRLRCLEEG